MPIALMAEGEVSVMTAFLTTAKEAIAGIVEIAGTAFTFMTDNPLMMLFIGGSLASLAFGIFKKARRAAR